MTFAFYSPPVRPHDEMLRQAAVEASGALAMTDAPELQRIVDTAAELLAAPMAALSIIDGDRQYLVARTGLDGRETSRAVSFCGHTVLVPEAALVVQDATLDDRFSGNPLVCAGIGIRFYAGVPLLGRAGMPLGALCVLDRAARPQVGEAALYALAALSAEASAAIYARRNTA